MVLGVGKSQLTVNQSQFGTVIAIGDIDGGGLGHVVDLNAAEGTEHRHQHAAL